MPVLGAHKGYTRTHQVIGDVREFGGGLEVAHRLAQANIITNKNLLPNDTPEDWDRPSGLRIGTTEVTRLGMGEVEMQAIADMIAGVLVEGRDPEHVKQEALELRAGFQTRQVLLRQHKGPGPLSFGALSAEIDLETLKRVEQRVLWLAASIVHHANRVRPNPSGVKVGGHQASSASMVSLMTALYFAVLEAPDRVSVKPHASPVLHAINHLLGRLDAKYLTTLRQFGGLQSYPSRTKDPDPVDYSTGVRRPRRDRADLGRARAPLRRRPLRRRRAAAARSP